MCASHFLCDLLECERSHSGTHTNSAWSNSHPCPLCNSKSLQFCCITHHPSPHYLVISACNFNPDISYYWSVSFPCSLINYIHCKWSVVPHFFTGQIWKCWENWSSLPFFSSFFKLFKRIIASFFLSYYCFSTDTFSVISAWTMCCWVWRNGMYIHIYTCFVNLHWATFFDTIYKSKQFNVFFL